MLYSSLTIMDQNQLDSLIEKYLLGTASKEERMSLLDWYRSSALNEVEWLMDELNEEELVKYRMYNNIQKQTLPLQKAASNMDRQFHMAWGKVAAAAVLVMFSLGILNFQSNRTKPFYLANKPSYHDHGYAAPKSNSAVLTLADGSKVNLDDAQSGYIAKQAGTSIVKAHNNELIYSSSRNENESTSGYNPIYNIISTPRGGKYKIVLPDGTDVWLNAASSLKYPTIFSGKERRVELTGEAYFEVAKNKEKPFVVTTPSADKEGMGQKIEVLGTHFNVNAYGDEGKTRTTLLEGSVKLITSVPGQGAKLLMPGQQSVVSDRNVNIVFVEVESTIAWKNGYFVFNNESISTIMSEISRWYDVDVYYDSPIDNIRLGGYISQSKKLSEVLDLLALTRKIHFKIEGRRIVVMR
jgi:transmembrane sensor